jgi:uncharacterized Zn finger protein
MPELSEPLLAAAAGWPVVHEARKIRAAGRVLKATFEPPLIKAAVRSGSRVYAAGLRLGSPLENLCSCGDSWMEGKICAHSVAAALVILQGQPEPKPKRTAKRASPEASA